MTMSSTRLEAFSDGVMAIIITIMVLEIKIPHDDATYAALLHLVPIFFSYVLSFIYVGIYWNNHHHLLHSVKSVNGRILWANLFLLFWLSMVPFATGWMGENHFASATLTVYGVVLLLTSIAYYILERAIIAKQGSGSLLKKALGKDFKGIASPILYVIGIAASFFNEWISGAIYVGVAFMWLVPDKRIESRVEEVAD